MQRCEREIKTFKCIVCNESSWRWMVIKLGDISQVDKWQRPH